MNGACLYLYSMSPIGLRRLLEEGLLQPRSQGSPLCSLVCDHMEARASVYSYYRSTECKTEEHKMGQANELIGLMCTVCPLGF